MWRGEVGARMCGVVKLEQECVASSWSKNVGWSNWGKNALAAQPLHGWARLQSYGDL